MSKMDIVPETVLPVLRQFIKSRVETLDRDGVIIGLSGGIDSAVVAALCAEAVGPDRVLALVMPERDSGSHGTRDALELAKTLDIRAKTIDLTGYLRDLGIYRLLPVNKRIFPQDFREVAIRNAYRFYKKKTRETPFQASLRGLRGKKYAGYLKKANAYYRVKHRYRMILLYLHAELENRLVVGAANRTEHEIGFFVKYGCDHAADIMPLLGLYKTQVTKLARHLEIPAAILEKKPSPDIIPGITDEDAIGMPYGKLDMILLAIDMGWEEGEIARALGVTVQEVSWIRSLVSRSEHMRTIGVPGEFY